jgi:PIN domain nuclease of toxin-antitoxin system
MTSILVDTHVWLWYINGSKELSKSAQKTIATALHGNQAYIAAISLWEIGMLDKKQRIILEMPALEWINKSIDITRINVAPITPEIAIESSFLPGKFHDDPADRLIVATARIEGLTLITRDKQILAYSKHKYLATSKA